MEHNTTFEVSSISKIEGDSKVKALASVVINNEFAVRGIRVMDSEKGLFVAMPNKKFGDEYADIAFPVTAEARKSINEAVMNSYNQLMQTNEKTLKNEISTAEKSSSEIKPTLKNVDYENTKAVGQIKIDDCFVVTGVKVIEVEGKPPFVSMPSYQTQTGEYKDFALPVTKEMREKLDKSVLDKYRSLDKIENKKKKAKAPTPEKTKQTAKHKR